MSILYVSKTQDEDNTKEEKTGPDRSVGPVQPGIGPQAGPVSTTKPVVVKTGQKPGKPVKTGKNR